MRWPGKWTKWERNLKRVIDLQKQMGNNLQLQVHSTMSSLTWLDLGNLYQYTSQLPIEYKLPFLIQVTQPAMMDAIHLPQKLKDKGYKQAIDSINSIDAQSWEVNNNRSLLEHVMQTDRDPDMWEEFIDQTNKLDRVRKQSILTFIPEYEEYWHD